ncbi:hypothetical protein LNO81_18565 [Klebsiella variicola subsp. variicola]|nr:hypothetical protein [Klebsiella variicola subsp. variicola]
MTSRISSGLPIFALSRHERTLNLTALYRGVTPVFFDSQNDGGSRCARCRQSAAGQRLPGLW